MNWLHYLAEANLYLVIFFLAYCLLLSRETHYQLNRIYLIMSCVIAFALPVFQIGALKSVMKPVESPTDYAMLMNAVQEANLQMNLRAAHQPAQANQQAKPTASKQAVQPVQMATPVTPQAVPQLSLGDYLWYAYLLGSAILLVLLLGRLISLFLLTRRTPYVKYGKYKIVQLPKSHIAFSFFNYLFLGDNAPATDTIITHELVHIRQKHSADIIFMELLKIINWFNPCIYLLQNSLKTVHEYIADEKTALHETDTLTYATFLVNTAHGIGGSSITHSFFNYNLLKKRIIMLNQKRSGNSARLKYLVTLPICAGLLCVSTLAFTKNYNLIDIDPAKAVATIIKPLLPKALSIKHQEATAANNVNAQPAALPVPHAKLVAIDSNTTTPSAQTVKDKVYLPFVSNGGYYTLAHYLHKNIQYKPAADDKGGVVIVGFTLDKNLKLSDLKIAQSAGDKLDALALDAFKNYEGTVNDDAGKYVEYSVYFFTNDYSIFNGDRKENGSTQGAVLVTTSPYKFNITPKGYEFDEAPNTMLSLNGQQKSSVWIYLKDGGYQYFQEDQLTEDQSNMLKNKYGYDFPTNSYPAMAFLPAINGNTNKYRWNTMDVNSYLNGPYTRAFYDHVYRNLKYPENEVADHKASLVMVNFNLDQNGAMSNVGIAKSGGADFDAAAVDAVSSFKGTIADKPGQHTVAIIFCLALDANRPAVSSSLKTNGYVGELARAERKSAWDNITFVPTTDNQSSYTINPAIDGVEKLRDIEAKLDKKGYTMNFDRSVDDAKQPLLKISIKTNPELSWQKEASATFSVNDLIKGGFVISIGADEITKTIFVRSISKK